jgi:Ca2+/Na+ antiporter
VIVIKQSINWIDAVVLLSLYVAYLWALLRLPPHEVEQLAEAPKVSNGRIASAAGAARRRSVDCSPPAAFCSM